MTNETISTDGHAGISGPVLKRAPIILDFCIFVLFEEKISFMLQTFMFCSGYI